MLSHSFSNFIDGRAAVERSRLTDLNLLNQQARQLGPQRAGADHRRGLSALFGHGVGLVQLGTDGLNRNRLFPGYLAL